jgi:hypothetical protein
VIRCCVQDGVVVDEKKKKKRKMKIQTTNDAID